VGIAATPSHGWYSAHSALPTRSRDATAWAKLRNTVRIMIAVPGNFAHPTRQWISCSSCKEQEEKQVLLGQGV
jgi:hypothetical protein